MSVTGKTLSIGAPSLWGMFKGYRSWTLKFRCGSCKAEPIVQHDEVLNYHKCPVCKEINILTETSWYDM